MRLVAGDPRRTWRWGGRILSKEVWKLRSWFQKKEYKLAPEKL